METDQEQVTIDGLAYGGAGFGRLSDGRVVFVPYSLPGERVAFSVLSSKKKYIMARVEAILEPSPERVAPRCKHFSVCGGCHYQHTGYTHQLEIKHSILTEQLRRIGKIDQPRVNDMIASPREWQYRNQVEFHRGVDDGLGFHSPHSRSILPIEECHIIHPALESAHRMVESRIAAGWQRVSVRKGLNELEIVFHGDSRRKQRDQIERYSMEDDRPSKRGMDRINDQPLAIRVLEHLFFVSEPSFFQVNIQQAENLVRHILENIEICREATLLDVYAGVGLFSRFLAPLAGRCLAIEDSPSACEDFATNLNDLDHVSLYQDDATRVLELLDEKPDVVIVDPPRAGLTPPALAALMRLRPARLVYVSCDAATLARDARGIIASGFDLISVQPFDMFPQTYHIETVCIFERVGSQKRNKVVKHDQTQ